MDNLQSKGRYAFTRGEANAALPDSAAAYGLAARDTLPSAPMEWHAAPASRLQHLGRVGAAIVVREHGEEARRRELFRNFPALARAAEQFEVGSVAERLVSRDSPEGGSSRAPAKAP